MKITSLANSEITFITQGKDNTRKSIILNPDEFVYTISDERNRSINIHGARRNLYIDMVDMPKGLEVFVPYTKESADLILNPETEEVSDPVVEEIQKELESNTTEANASNTASQQEFSGSLQDGLVLTEEGKKAINIEELIIEESDPYADINIGEIIPEKKDAPKRKRKPSSKKGPGRPKKRGPKPKKKPMGRPPGVKNKKKKKK